jgi:hypothetical protein
VADDLDDVDEAEGGPQPPQGRELVIVDLRHPTMMPGSARLVRACCKAAWLREQIRQAKRSALP